MSFVVHAHIDKSNMGAVAITDSEYPARVAHKLLLQTMEETVKKHGSDVVTKTTKDANLDVPDLQNLLSRYQNPGKVDKVAEIEKGRSYT
jgi:hypothetical protein